MSEKSKPKIDELLSGFVDGELSERQRTELKRLMQHDDELSQRLNELKRQKQLLGALPIASAPEGLLDDVKATLERQSILDNASARCDDSAGVRHLMFRRFVTTAAMFSLVGVLVWVVLNVVMPLDSESKESFSIKQTLSTILAPKSEAGDVVRPDRVAVAEIAPFESRLDLVSDQAIALNNFIEKSVYNNGLRDDTIPRRGENSTTYEISGSSVKVLALLGDLQTVWDRCGSASFSVDGAGGLLVNDITAEQILAIFTEQQNDTRVAMAKNYASFNSESKTLAGAGKKDSSNITIPIPILTAPPAAEDEATNSEGGQQVKLTITVTAL
jgi:hypothetical protein